MASPKRAHVSTPAPGARILVIDDDVQMRTLLARLITSEGHEATTASSGREGLEKVEDLEPDVVMTDVQMPGLSGIDVLKSMRSNRPDVPVFVLTGHTSVDTAIEALREGAFDYIPKPFNIDYVAHQLERALTTIRMKRELRELRHALSVNQNRFERGLLGKSLVMEKLFEGISRVARNDVPVLIHGETGTGKELVAREVHTRSERSGRPFLAINCGALAENLLESELFGHVRGAFTGASSDKKGLFEAARGGTLFLDELGETPLSLQVKLLRVLQEREVRPVGSTQPRSIDVRVVAATNRNLLEEIAAERFRQDLYYRLNVFPMNVPPLRDRSEDIPLLAMHFLEQCASRYNTSAQSFSAEAMMRLVSYAWPGNVRELQNIVVRAATWTDGDEVGMGALPAELRDTHLVTHDLEGHIPTLEEMERRHIERVLERCEGNKKEAASFLGIDRSTLYRKLKLYGLGD